MDDNAPLILCEPDEERGSVSLFEAFFLVTFSPHPIMAGPLRVGWAGPETVGTPEGGFSRLPLSLKSNMGGSWEAFAEDLPGSRTGFFENSVEKGRTFL